MNQVGEIQQWLEHHTARMQDAMQRFQEAKRQNDEIQRQSTLNDTIVLQDDQVFLPASYVSHFPELIAHADAETDLLKLVDFFNQKKGLAPLLLGGYQPFGRPFEQFDPRELKAAFLLQAPPPGSAPSKSRYAYGNNAGSAGRKRSRPSSTIPPQSGGSATGQSEDGKRLKQSPGGSRGYSKSPVSRSTSPVPPSQQRSSPHSQQARSRSPIAMTNKPPPLPAGAPRSSLGPPLPPLPPPRPSGGTAAPPLPPLPPGRPPPLPPQPRLQHATSSSIMSDTAVGEEQMEEDENEFEEDGSDFELDEAQHDHLMIDPALFKEMNRIVHALIHIKTWPKVVRPIITKSRSKQNPTGNPFAVPLIRGETISVPDYYFDKIKKPLDLSTIRTRLSQGFYVSFEQFAKDVKLVAENAVEFNTQGPPNLLAVHFHDRARNELEQGQLSLGLL